jgi:hypothetical protein
MKKFLVLGFLFAACPPVTPNNPPNPQPIGACELGASYTFYSDGLRQFQERVTISTKGEFSITRLFSNNKNASCKAQISCDMGNILNLKDVQGALSHPDVEKAFSAGVEFYGQDNRPRDIPAFVIEGPRGKIQVGQECQQTLGGVCVEIPKGVSAAVEMLRNVREQYLGQGDCPSLPSSM